MKQNFEEKQRQRMNSVKLGAFVFLVIVATGITINILNYSYDRTLPTVPIVPTSNPTLSPTFPTLSPTLSPTFPTPSPTTNVPTAEPTEEPTEPGYTHKPSPHR